MEEELRLPLRHHVQVGTVLIAKEILHQLRRISSRALEWPTLTTQWLPDVKEVPGKAMRQHRLLLGTHTSGQQVDYLQIGHLNLPNPPPATLADYNSTTEELGGKHTNR